MNPMGIKDRLQRLTGEKRVDSGATRTGDGSRKEEIRTLRERIDAVMSRRPEGRREDTFPANRGRGVPLEDLVHGGGDNQ